MSSSESLTRAVELLRAVVAHDDAILKDDPWYAMESSERERIDEFLEANSEL